MNPFELRTHIIEIEKELERIRLSSALTKLFSIIKVFNLIKLKEKYEAQLEKSYK